MMTSNVKPWVNCTQVHPTASAHLPTIVQCHFCCTLTTLMVSASLDGTLFSLPNVHQRHTHNAQRTDAKQCTCMPTTLCQIPAEVIKLALCDVRRALDATVPASATASRCRRAHRHQWRLHALQPRSKSITVPRRSCKYQIADLSATVAARDGQSAGARRLELRTAGSSGSSRTSSANTTFKSQGTYIKQCVRSAPCCAAQNAPRASARKVFEV
jgi:hypothetical protein